MDDEPHAHDPWLLSSSMPSEPVPPTIERPAWQRALAVAAAVAVVLGGVVLLTRGTGTQHAAPPSTNPSTSSPTPSTAPAAPGDSAWVATAPSPLSPRNNSQGVWTGSEVVVFGGTTQPDCPACDYYGYGDTLHDGAIYSPIDDTWRAMSPLPDEASYVGQSVAFQGDVFFYSLFQPDVTASVQTYRLWRYSVSGDQWSEVPLPSQVPKAFALTTSSNALLLYSATDEFGLVPDWSFGPTTNEWTALPDDGFDASFDRQIVEVGGNLMLFNHSIALVQNGVTSIPTRMARFDDATQQWTQLPENVEVQSLWFADGSWVVSPQFGVYDARFDMWRPGPANPPDDVMGAIGPSVSYFGGVRGSVLDMRTNTWIRIPTLPDGLDDESGATTVTAGRDAFTFGGTTGMQPNDPVHNQSYIWHAPAPPAPHVAETDQTGLDAALRDLGIDRGAAPTEVVRLGDAVFCGYEDNGISGDDAVQESARRCFVDRLARHEPAMFITQRPTEEGDPVATVFVTGHDGTVRTYIDATRDTFGSGRWDVVDCTPFSSSDSGTHLDFACAQAI